jgi:hypothetical protein
MNRYDFTKTGGFPFTQDVLKDMQDLYLAGMQNICTMLGSNPFIISGMITSGTSISDGWFFYNGDLCPFTGGTIPTPAGSDAVLVTITPGTGTLLFNDGSTPVVKIGPTAALTTGPTVTDATHFPLASFQAFYSGLAGMIKESEVHAAISVAGGFITGDLYRRIDHLNNTMRVRGNLFVNSGIGGSGSYGLWSTGVIPAHEAPFRGTVTFNGFSLDATGKDYLTDIALSLDTTGSINILAYKGSANYTITVNAILPLD